MSFLSFLDKTILKPDQKEVLEEIEKIIEYSLPEINEIKFKEI